MRVLTVPDCHVEPGQNLSRFDLLSYFIVDHRPDYIVFMGDFSSMSALSRWDMNKRAKMEGRRFQLDIASANTALDMSLAGLDRYNAHRRALKERQYRPELYFLMGNHEDWANQYMEMNPEMSGLLDVAENLLLEERGFSVVPYRGRLTIKGVTFCHAPQHEGNSLISGVNVPRKGLARHSGSLVHAHTHRWEMHHMRRLDDKELSMALSVGCFFEETPSYAKGAEPSWWAGLTLLNIYNHKEFDTEQWSMHRLKEAYGD